METVNSQILDAIKQVNTFLKDSDFSLHSIASQLTVEAAGIAMMNIVNQQQQLYALQNAVTTCAVKNILSSNPQEALSIMNNVIKENNMAANLDELKKIIQETSSNTNQKTS